MPDNALFSIGSFLRSLIAHTTRDCYGKRTNTSLCARTVQAILEAGTDSFAMALATALTSVCDYTASRLRLSDTSQHQRHPLAFTTGEKAMPQTPQSHPANQPRTDKEPGMTQEQDVPSDGKDEQGEQMVKELGRDKPGPNFSNPQSGKE